MASKREKIWKDVLSARRGSDRPKSRMLELVFFWELVSPTNKEAEGISQVSKADEYEHLSPLQSTEAMCEAIVDAAYAMGFETPIRRQLGDNNVRTINKIWRIRQIADIGRRPYPEMARGLVEILSGLLDGPVVITAAYLCFLAEQAASGMDKEG